MIDRDKWLSFAMVEIEPVEPETKVHKWQCPQLFDVELGEMRDITQEDVEKLCFIREAYVHLKQRLFEAQQEAALIITSKDAKAPEEDEMKDFSEKDIEAWYTSRTLEQDKEREKNGWQDPMQSAFDAYEKIFKPEVDEALSYGNITVKG